VTTAAAADFAPPPAKRFDTIPLTSAGYVFDLVQQNAFGHAPSGPDYAARRIISVNVARPSSVNEYGAFKPLPVFAISRLRLRYWNSAFND
jgi:hypothetical protein